MNVILCEDVENVGEMGNTVKVADGYARNFLIPRKLAVRADSASAKQIEHEMRIIKKREEKKRAEQAQLAKKLEGVTIEFKVRAGEGDKIFGSVTSAHIAEKLSELGHEISKKSIQLAEPIKALGVFSAPVKMPGGIEAKLKIWVTKIEEEVKAGAPEAAAAADAADAADADDADDAE